MDQVDIANLIPPKQQNPLLKRKPLNLGTSFVNYLTPDTPAQIQNPLTAHQITLLYFSAAWCNISKSFTKLLIPYYEQINLQRKKLQIINISMDKLNQQYEEGIKEMPWLGIGANDPRVGDLKEFYNIRSVPTLVLIDKRGEEVWRDCRQDVYSIGQDEAFLKWKNLKDQQQSKY